MFKMLNLSRRDFFSWDGCYYCRLEHLFSCLSCLVFFFLVPPIAPSFRARVLSYHHNTWSRPNAASSVIAHRVLSLFSVDCLDRHIAQDAVTATMTGVAHQICFCCIESSIDNTLNHKQRCWIYTRSDSTSGNLVLLYKTSVHVTAEYEYTAQFL